MSSRAPLRLILAGALLGVAVAVTVLALRGRHAPVVEPDRSLGALLPEADGRIAEVAMHWTVEMDGLVADSYTDFLRALPDDVAVTLVVSSGMPAADRGKLDERLLAIEPKGRLK